MGEFSQITLMVEALVSGSSRICGTRSCWSVMSTVFNDESVDQSLLTLLRQRDWHHRL